MSIARRVQGSAVARGAASAGFGALGYDGGGEEAPSEAGC